MRAGPHQHTERGSDRSRAASTFLTHRRQSVLSFVFSMGRKCRFGQIHSWRNSTPSDAAARCWVGYTLGAASVALASAARAGAPELLSGIPFATYFIAVVLTAVAGGWRAGILALTLSLAAGNYLASGSVVPTTPDEWVAAALFVAVAAIVLGLVCLLNHAIDRMWYQAESARMVVEFQPAGVVGVDAAGRITMVNSAVERQLGYSREELLNRPFDQLVPEDVRNQHADPRASYLVHPEPRMMGAGRALSAVARDGSRLPVEVGLNPVAYDGRVGALATIGDISERKKLEQRTRILANEVSHRSRNLLAIVRALALRKLPRESAADFVGILDALARTQDVFGRKTVAPLKAILEAELAGFGAQTSITGCDVELTPSAGQDFSLIFHELATNAAKHGALSTRTGEQGGRSCSRPRPAERPHWSQGIDSWDHCRRRDCLSSRPVCQTIAPRECAVLHRSRPQALPPALVTRLYEPDGLTRRD
jgi:PAS domain S-box-containing protein